MLSTGITIFFLAFAAFLSFLDLFLNWEDASEQSTESQVLLDKFEDVSNSQWEWLLSITSLTLPVAASFVLVELFRVKRSLGDQNQKSEVESVVEGVFLGLLVLGWLPSVIIATTPGGAASQVGNAYFFTWACTVFVMETSVWWIHDWRKGIHKEIQQQEEEYRKIQQKVLANTRTTLTGQNDSGKKANKLNSPTDSHEENDKHVTFARTRSEDEVGLEALPEDDMVSQDEDNEEPEYEGVIPDVIGT